MNTNKVIRIHPPWRKPPNNLQLWLWARGPYVPDVNLKGRIEDAVKRVHAARERQRQERLDRVVVDDFVQRRQHQLGD